MLRKHGLSSHMFFISTRRFIFVSDFFFFFYAYHVIIKNKFLHNLGTSETSDVLIKPVQCNSRTINFSNHNWRRLFSRVSAFLYYCCKSACCSLDDSMSFISAKSTAGITRRKKSNSSKLPRKINRRTYFTVCNIKVSSLQQSRDSISQ